MRSGISLLLTILATLTCVLDGKTEPTKIAIIKADDVRSFSTNWNRFFERSKEKSVKVSAGIICETLASHDPTYASWLLEWEKSGWVEFWNHGWDHKRWKDQDGGQISEFKGTGYVHQKQHFESAQEHMRKVFGYEPIAFGTPYNALDADTIRVMNENPHQHLFFCYGSKPKGDEILAPMILRGEHDGTGKPNFEKFKAAYLEKPDVQFSAIQFHPDYFEERHFDEYSKIIEFMLQQGWSFVTPKEYVQLTAY